MAEQDKASKTEEPTAKKQKESQEEGNFAKAQEIQVAMGLAASFALLLFYAEKIGFVMRDTMTSMFNSVGSIEINSDLAIAVAREGTLGLVGLVSPILIGAALTSILAGGIQSGFKPTPKAIKMKGSKLNPIKNFTQKFGPSAWVRFGVDFLKFAAIGGVIAVGVNRATKNPIFFTRVEPTAIAGFIFETTLLLLSLLIVAMGLIAAGHFAYQKQKVWRDMFMTRQEVKDEHKSQEGDPLVKMARRQLARKLMERQMFAAIPQADVVVTNPTHYAIALKYDRTTDAAPMILAKGRNLIAERIKQIARENKVPVMENKPAARALYKLGKTGQPIPREMYKVVAEILAFVYRTYRRHRFNVKA